MRIGGARTSASTVAVLACDDWVALWPAAASAQRGVGASASCYSRPTASTPLSSKGDVSRPASVAVAVAGLFQVAGLSWADKSTLGVSEA